MPQFLITWIVTAVSMLIASYLITGINITSFEAAAIGAIFLGLVNAIVRPLLVFFTFPLTLFSLGLFLFVINAICFSLVAYLTPSFTITGFLDALFGSIIVSVVSSILNKIFEKKKKKKKKK